VASLRSHTDPHMTGRLLTSCELKGLTRLSTAVHNENKVPTPCHPTPAAPLVKYMSTMSAVGSCS
jgi:hypothetical protein